MWLFLFCLIMVFATVQLFFEMIHSGVFGDRLYFKVKFIGFDVNTERSQVIRTLIMMYHSGKYKVELNRQTLYFIQEGENGTEYIVECLHVSDVNSYKYGRFAGMTSTTMDNRGIIDFDTRMMLYDIVAEAKEPEPPADVPIYQYSNLKGFFAPKQDIEL